VGHDHAAAIERFVHQARRCFLDQRQAPIQKKLAAAGQVLGPECDFIDTENAHSVSLVKQCFQFETLNRLFDDLKHRSIEIRVRVQVLHPSIFIGVYSVSSMRSVSMEAEIIRDAHLGNRAG
jgi:hypothetical protein